MTEHSQQPPAQTLASTLQDIFNLAQFEAAQLDSWSIAPEHLLLGILHSNNNFNLAANFLETTLQERFSSLYQELRTELVNAGPSSLKPPTVHQLRPETLTVLTHMFEESRRLQQAFVTSLHLLYGILEEQRNLAAQMLKKQGLSAEQVHMTLELMTEPLEPLSSSNTLQLPPVNARSFSSTETISHTITQAPGQPSRFDRFSSKAQDVLRQAQEEAMSLQHNYIGTEHLLLGIVHDESNVASHILNTMGIEPDKVREATYFILNKGEKIVKHALGLTPRAKKVIELAIDEARKLGYRYIGTEHLLLAITREGDGIAAGILNSLGADEQSIRAAALEILSARSEAGEQEKK